VRVSTDDPFDPAPQSPSPARAWTPPITPLPRTRAVWAGRAFALQENGLPFEFALRDDGSIASVGFEDFDGALSFPFSAHPKVHPATGELHFHGYELDPVNGASKWYGVLSERADADEAAAHGEAAEARVRLADHVQLPSEYSNGLAHDMAITRSHALLFDTSIVVSMQDVLEGKFGGFDERRHARVGVLPLGGGGGGGGETGGEAADRKAAWFNLGQPLGIVHPMHAWEEDGGQTIVLWTPVCSHFDGSSSPNNEAHMAE